MQILNPAGYARTSIASALSDPRHGSSCAGSSRMRWSDRLAGVTGTCLGQIGSGEVAAERGEVVSCDVDQAGLDTSGRQIGTRNVATSADRVARYAAEAISLATRCADLTQDSMPRLSASAYVPAK